MREISPLRKCVMEIGGDLAVLRWTATGPWKITATPCVLPSGEPALLAYRGAAVAPLALLLPETRLWWSLLLLPASWPLLRAMMRTPRSGALNAVLARSGRWGLLTCLVVGGLIVAG